MDIQIISTILVTLITVLGGNAAWKYYEKRLSFRLEQQKLDSKEDTMHINDLRSRIEKLEKLLKESANEKDDLREEIIKLTSTTATMKAELQYLAKENQLLRKLIGADAKKKAVKKRK